MAYAEAFRPEREEPKRREGTPEQSRELLIKAKALRDFWVDNQGSENGKRFVEDAEKAVKVQNEGKATRTRLYQMIFNGPKALTREVQQMPLDLYDENGRGVVAMMIDELYEKYVAPQQGN